MAKKSELEQRREEIRKLAQELKSKVYRYKAHIIGVGKYYAYQKLYLALDEFLTETSEVQ